MTVVCEWCGASFDRPRGSVRRFCSLHCGAMWRVSQGYSLGHTKDPAKHGTKTCPVCGKDFEYLLTQPPRTCCSRSCAAKLRAQEKRHPFQTQKREPGKRTTTACPTCGKEFTYLASWPRKYCSNRCAGLGYAGTNLPNYGNGYDASCETCGKVFRANKTVRGRFCSSKCFGKWQSEHIRGEVHPLWRGGAEPYYGLTWDAARRAVRIRDKVCQGCGISPKELGRSLDVHHLKPFRTFGRNRHQEANDLSNLVALCPTCHTAWEWAGRRGEPYPKAQRGA